ncbi:MAG: hypothetical protein IPP35_11665 [Elusimicrobia bacterium]|nr:hypothetical protein [Elusimicrobiota bacterium]
MVRGFALLIPIFQILAAVHAFRNGRESYWLWIILLFPGAGTLIYFFSEILPDIRRGSLWDLWEETLSSWIPGRQLKRLREQLEMTDTVANRQALAEFLLELGRDPSWPFFRNVWRAIGRMTLKFCWAWRGPI